MEVLRIFGGNRLSGVSTILSAKNAVMPILAAAVMVPEPVILRNCPRLTDTENMLRILETLGVSCQWRGNDIHIDASSAHGHEMPGELSRQLRSSIFMLGPLLARFSRATVTYPGGCEIGLRPIDLHLKSLKALGVKVREAHGMIYCDGKELAAGEIHLDFPSVGATENAMMAAVLVEGRTVIYNSAREPEILDLERFINSAGGDVRGAGTGTIEINGITRLHGTSFSPIPDRIVAGTVLVAAAMTGGDVELRNVDPIHMTATIDKLRQAGCRIDSGHGTVKLVAPGRLSPIVIETSPFPGFPTDMQAQFMAMCAVADGTSVIVENLFENRFAHAAELRSMGADITVHSRTAIIRGRSLTGARVEARDLRGGAALVLAGLVADGVTEVEHVSFIDRGYQEIETTLNKLGARIVRL